MFGVSQTLTRIALAVIAVVLVLGFLQVRSCQRAKQEAAQSRLDRAQAGAAQESAAEAIATHSEVNANQVASEALTRSNAEEIRNARGANAIVDTAASDAGLRAVCRRATYRDTDQCRLLISDPKRMEKAR